MRAMLRRYAAIAPAVKRFILAELLLMLVNVVLMLVLNLYLRRLGYDDAFIARITSWRFLAVLLLAMPVGILIRGRSLRPLLIVASLLIPGATWVMLWAAESGLAWLLSLSVALWGLGMMSLQVSNLPFIMRHSGEDTASEAISLSFSAFPVGLLLCGLLVPVLQSLGSVRLGGWSWSFDEAGVIRALALLGLLALPLVLRLEEAPARNPPGRLLGALRGEHDWGRILRVAFPNMVIAVGAGLTIPFINLFFNSVFGLEADDFSMLGGGAGVLVLLGALLNPAVRRRWGYGVAVTLSQSLAVGFLVLLALTELYSQLPGAFLVAAFCFLLRQPLMNMAGPITSELAMSYVGPRNRELVAALQASIWSGSWFVSARLFQLLRSQELHYWQIFLLTAGLYSVGIALFARLIRRHLAERPPLAAR